METPDPSPAAPLEEYEELSGFLHALSGEVRRTASYEEIKKAMEAKGYGGPWRRGHVRPPVTADLHTHTNVSDGIMSPAEVVRIAGLLGLLAVGVADHDSVDGLAEAYAESLSAGISFWPGLELSTGRPGCEILVYWPAASGALDFLAGGESGFLHAYLRAVQRRVHEDALAAVAAVNGFLRRLDPARERDISPKDLGAWYRGVEPYYPGTVAVLGLAQLTEEEKERTGLRDPRAFNTAVVTPALRGRSGGDRMGEVLEIIRSLRRTGPPSLAALAHPKELLTKGGMSLGEAREFVLSQSGPGGLDGLEVNNSRDDAADTDNWLAFLGEANIRRARAGLEPWLGFCHSSDFHVLAPGTATGELTLGYGRLDERPANRRGNLRPVMGWEEFRAAVASRISRM